MDFLTFMLYYYGLSFINIFLFDSYSNVNEEDYETLHEEIIEIKYELTTINRQLRDIRANLNSTMSV